MRVETLIRHRTEEKEIRLSGSLVLSKEAWEQRGGLYHGTLADAARESWYTVRTCELMGFPVSDNEFQSCKDFAMFKSCYTENCLINSNGKTVRPCLPVFYRDKKVIKVKLKKKALPHDDEHGTHVGGWADDYITTLEKALELMNNNPGQYKFAGYVRN